MAFTRVFVVLAELSNWNGNVWPCAPRKIHELGDEVLVHSELYFLVIISFGPVDDGTGLYPSSHSLPLIPRPFILETACALIGIHTNKGYEGTSDHRAEHVITGDRYTTTARSYILRSARVERTGIGDKSGEFNSVHWLG